VVPTEQDEVLQRARRKDPQKHSVLAEGPARVRRLFLVAQAICLRRRRRARPRRPPQVATRPGSPAPTIGPGTAASTVCRSTLLASPNAVTSRYLKAPAPAIFLTASQGSPGPPTDVQLSSRVPPGIVPLPRVPAVFVPHTCHVSPLVVLLAEKLMVREVRDGRILKRSSWMKLPTVISLSPLGSFVRPAPFSSVSLPVFALPNSCTGPGRPSPLPLGPKA